MTEDRVGESDLDYCTNPGHRQPDSIQGGHDGAGRFPRDRPGREIVVDCDDNYRAQQAQGISNGRDQGEGDDENPAEPTRPDPVIVVTAFLAERRLDTLFNGTMTFGNAPRMAYSHADVEGWLSATRDVDPEWVSDEVILQVRRGDVELPDAEIKRAVRKVVREEQKERGNQVLRPLLKALLSPEEAAHAKQEWARLVAGVLEEDVAFGSATLKHLIWQVKQKQLGRPVKHHLMPVIFSPVQGSGKTTFVLKFLGPLKELAAGPVPLSDFADPRSGDIFRFPVTFC